MPLRYGGAYLESSHCEKKKYDLRCDTVKMCRTSAGAVEAL